MIRKGRQLPPLSPNYRYDVVKTKHLQRDRSGNLVVHNHPSGDPTLSQADIHMTKAIVQIATRHFRARPHHRRQERTCEFEGDAADLARRLHLPSINYPLRALANA